MPNETKLVTLALVALLAGTAAAAPKKDAAPPEPAKEAPKEAKEGDRAAAKVHFGAGKQFYKESRYEDAIREFAAAYRYDPNPLLLYNLAQADEKAGNIPDAL